MFENNTNDKQVLQRKIFAYYYWGCTILWMIIIFSFSAYPHSDVVTKKMFHVFNYSVRKLAHMSEFGFLYFLTNRAFNAMATKSGDSPSPSLKAFILTFLYALTDEWHQSYVPGRSAQLFDVLIDSIGIGIAMSIMAIPGLYSRAQPEQT